MRPCNLHRDDEAVSAAVATVLLFGGVISIIGLMLLSMMPIIQELEGVFRGAGWNVIKVIWGEEWDALLAKDEQGLLLKRMNEVVDGQYQKYVVMPGSYIREHFFGDEPELAEMVSHLSDEKLKKL